MQSSCEAPCCSTRSWNQSPGVTHHKFSTDERWKKYHEKFRSLHRIPYILCSFHLLDFQTELIDKISKKRPNATQVLKNRWLLSSAVPSVWPNLPNYLTRTVPASNSSETASAWRHEKEVLLHRRSPNFELVEINSTLSCKVVSEQILTDFWRRQNRWVSYWCRGSFRDRQHLELKIDGRITRIFNCESLCGGSSYPKKSPTFTPTFKSSKTRSTLRGHSPSLCPRRTSILTVQAGRLKMPKPSPVLS